MGWPGSGTILPPRERPPYQAAALIARYARRLRLRRNSTKHSTPRWTKVVRRESAPAIWQLQLPLSAASMELFVANELDRL